MSDGLKAQHRAAIIAALAANDRVERAVLFGSRAMGTNTITSDVDIALFGDRLTLTDQAHLAATCDDLPMAQSVDLVLHNTIGNPALVDHIRSHGVEWYRRDGGVVQANNETPNSFVQATARWKTTSWGQISTLEYGKRLRDYKNDTGKFTVYGTNGVVGTCDKYLCNRPGVIIGRKGAYRGVHYSNKPFYVIDTAYWLNHSEKVDTKYAYYELLNQDINSLDSGSAIPSTSKESFYSLSVLLPPLEEQKAIAHILGTLDDKIELNRRMNETLEAMARAIFKDWFVDFGPVRAKVEGQEAYLPEDVWGLFPDSFQESELGEIPRGWGVRRLEDYLELAYGKSLPARSRRPGAVPVYGSGGVVGSHDVALTKGPTVIVGRKGTVGSLYLEAKPAFPIDTVFYTLPRIGSMLFSYHLLACQPLKTMNTDAAVPGLNRSNVYRLQFPCPTSNLTSVFDDIVECFWKRQVANLDESDVLVQVRDLLLPRLIGDELRMKGSEEFAGASI